MTGSELKIPDIKIFQDARSYLVAFVEMNIYSEQKATYRTLAKRIGWPFGYLNDVVKGRRTLTAARALQFANALAMDSSDTDRLMYFSLIETRDKNVSEFFKQKMLTGASADHLPRDREQRHSESIEAAPVLEFHAVSR